MFEDDDRPKPQNRFVPPRFEGWSIADLREHIAALREDIARAEATIAARASSQAAADSVFRKPGA